MAVKIYSSWNEKDMKKAFLWGPTYQPWSDTLVYYPLDWDFNDYSGNNRNLTNSGWTFVSGWQWQVAVFASGTTAYYQNNTLFNISYPFTYSVIFQTDAVQTWYYNSSNPYNMPMIGIQNWDTQSTRDKELSVWLGWILGYNYNNWTYWVSGWSIVANTRYHAVYTFDWSTQKLYLNWTLVGSNSCGWSYTGYSNARLVLAKQLNSGDVKPFTWKLSEVIMEKKVWTASEVTQYLNSIKSLYWIN